MTSNNYFFPKHHVGDRLSEEDLKVIEKMTKLEIEPRFEIVYEDGRDERFLTLLNDSNLKTTEFYYSEDINGDDGDMLDFFERAVDNRWYGYWDRVHGGTRLCLIIRGQDYYIKMCEASSYDKYHNQEHYVSVVFHPND